MAKGWRAGACWAVLWAVAGCATARGADPELSAARRAMRRALDQRADVCAREIYVPARSALESAEERARVRDYPIAKLKAYEAELHAKQAGGAAVPGCEERHGPTPPQPTTLLLARSGASTPTDNLDFMSGRIAYAEPPMPPSSGPLADGSSADQRAEASRLAMATRLLGCQVSNLELRAQLRARRASPAAPPRSTPLEPQDTEIAELEARIRARGLPTARRARGRSAPPPRGVPALPPAALGSEIADLERRIHARRTTPPRRAKAAPNRAPGTDIAELEKRVRARWAKSRAKPAQPKQQPAPTRPRKARGSAASTGGPQLAKQAVPSAPPGQGP